MKKVNIGFDIGIASVGWAVVDEDNQIIIRGVRLFEELKDPKDGKLKNEERRAKRALRRTIRRKINRKADFIKLIFNKYVEIFDFKQEKEFDLMQNQFLEKINLVPTSIIDIRNKAIKGEINKDELLKILYYFLSHRGYTYVTSDMYEEQKEILAKGKNNNLEELSNWLEKNLKVNNEELEIQALKYNQNKDFKTWKQVIAAAKKFKWLNEKDSKFPCEIQLKEFLENGHYQGLDVNSSFSIHDYKKEIKKIISNQSYLPKSFVNDYYEDKNSVFSRIREYSKGPGSENSPSEYGLYRKDSNNETYKIGDNLWDVLVGNCSVYPEEKRAIKRSISGEFSNLISQLNIIRINSDKFEKNKLSKLNKIAIFNEMFKSPKFKKVSVKLIAAVSGCEFNQVLGFPTKTKFEANSNNIEAFDEFKNSSKIFNALNKHLKLNSFEDMFKNINFLDDIIAIFLKHKDNIDGQKKELKIIFDNYKIELSNEIEEDLLKAKIQVGETHSMSLKALREHIRDEIKSFGLTLNQKFKKIIEENEIKQFKFSKSKYMNPKCLDHEIMSPTTKCSFREVIKIFNKILKLHVYKNHFKIKNIVFEMPTESNSVDERKRMNEIQRKNETLKNDAKNKYQYEGDDKKIIAKLHFLSTQDGIDVYDGEPLEINKVINDPNYTEIDHIIPYSISYDDSFNNKVLTKRHNNQEKAKRIPRDFLVGKFFSLEKLWIRLYNEKNSAFYNPKKYNNLIIHDVSKHEAGFIGRNLADTRYASRLAKTAFNSWIKMKIDSGKNNLTVNDDDEINILNINGRTSQQYRSPKYLNIGKKNRDENHHHAIDATICAVLGNADNTVGKLVWSFLRKINDETGEITYSRESKYLDNGNNKYSSDKIPWNHLGPQVANLSDIKFSFKVQKKINNFGFWGDTILSIKSNKEGFQNKKYIEPLKYQNYIDAEKAINELKKYWIDKNNKNTYPDPNILNDVLKIWNQYSIKCQNDKDLAKRNPFNVYMEDLKNENIAKITRSSKPRLYILRKNYSYFVNSLFTWEKINSFAPINNKNYQDMIENKNFGGYTKLDWKEIRIYKMDDFKYRIISITIDLLKKNKNGKFILDEKKLAKELEKYKVPNNAWNNFYTISKGNCLISKKNKEILKIVGRHQILNLLEVKSLELGKQKQSQISINTLMLNYQFCNIDELGNIQKVDF